jgi:hypothetical protein
MVWRGGNDSGMHSIRMRDAGCGMRENPLHRLLFNP